MRIGMIVAIILLLAAPVVLADGKTTEDPNESPAVTAEQGDAGDIRLAQKVTYEAKKKPVLDVLADLAEKTKVTFRVGKNSQDWQVRDRKVNIFAKDVPLSRLMSSIARALKMKWSKSEDEKPVYRLVADQRALKEADAELARIQREREQKMMERRQKAAEAFSKCADLSEADLVKLKKENPFLHFCAESGLSRSLGGLFKEAPGVLDALMNGRAMNLSAANLPSGAHQAIAGTIASLNNLEGRFGRKRELPSNLADSVGTATIAINSHMDEMGGMMPVQGFILGTMEFKYQDADGGQRTESVPLIDPDSKFAQIIGKALTKCEDEGKTMEEVGKEIETELQAEMMKAMTSELKAEEPGEKPAEHPDDPDLAKKIKTEDFTGMQFEDLLPKIATASEFALVSDSFGGISKRMGRPTWEKETELKAALEKVGESYRYSWDKHGPVIELWDKQWAKRIAAMVPEAWLERWRDCLKKGTFDIGELAEMASLTQEQFNTIIVGEEGELAGVAWESRRNRDGLMVYAGLDDAQRQMLFSQSGLDLRSLGPDLWALIEKSLNAQNASFLANADARLTVFCSRQEQDGRRNYSFRITTSEGLPEISWSTSWSVRSPVTTRAVEPAKQAEKPK